MKKNTPPIVGISEPTRPAIINLSPDDEIDIEIMTRVFSRSLNRRLAGMSGIARLRAVGGINNGNR